MNKRITAVSLLLMILALTGCGGGGNSSPPAVVTTATFVTQILSTQAIDGDIAETSPNVFSKIQGGPSVSAGIDPVTLAEYRSFLHFPQANFPSSATIVSAKLRIFINDIRPSIGTIPLFIDLVSFPPPTLIANDFFQTALSTISTSIFQSDFRNYVVIDVTPLMKEAQRLVLPNFQIRIREDRVLVGPGLIDGIITIDDAAATLAPQLEVTYF